MSFVQAKLTLLASQSIGGSNLYSYWPNNGDELADVIAYGYFAESRFIGTDGWVGGYIFCILANGPYLLLVDMNRVSAVEFAGSGSMTGAEIIAAINATLGNNYWQQGVSNCIFINDLSETSPELAPYVNGAGQWEIPDSTLLIVNTDAQTFASVVSRTFLLKGKTYIQPSVPGGAKGLTLYSGTPLPTAMFLNDSSFGAGVFVGDVTILSDDTSRPIYDLETNVVLFTINAHIIGGYNLGFVNSTQIYISADFMLDSLIPFVVGNECDAFTISNVDAGFDYPLNTFTGFDLSVPPVSGHRTIFANNLQTGSDPSSGFFVLGADDGTNRGFFNNCLVKNGNFIYSTASSTFNANPLFSPNFDFSVVDFGKTQRIGELYFSGTSAAITLPGATWTDVSSVAIADGGLSNGLVPTSNPGELQYILPEASMVNVRYHIEGSAGGVGDQLHIGAFYQPNVGTYSQITKASYPVEGRGDSPSPSRYVVMGCEFTIVMNPGDTVKPMVRTTSGATTYGVTIFNATAEVVGS